MSFYYSIGKDSGEKFPEALSLRHYFEEYDELEWAYRGASGAGFNIYGANNTGHLEPFESRIDIHLHLYDYPDLGIYILF